MNYSLLVAIFFTLFFSYVDFFGLRLLPFFTLIIIVPMFISFFSRGFEISRDKSFFLGSILFLFILSLSMLGGDYNILFACFVFLLLAYWPFFIKINSLNLELMIASINKIYLFSAFFISIGLFVQQVLYFRYGVIFGKFDIYGGERIAFGFLWSDYSFLSLYLVGCIPIVLNQVKFRFHWKVIVSIVLLIGSVATTARTGVFSFFVILCIYLLFNFISLLRNKFFYIVVPFFSLLFVLLFFLIDINSISNREFSTSSSGRFDGYIDALYYFTENPFFGALMNPGFYRDTVGVIPHNLLIYMLVSGGLLFTFLFFGWFFLIFKEVKRTKDIGLLYSFLIFFVGFQFIPSFYSAYFFAVYLSIVFLTNRYIVVFRGEHDSRNR